MVSVHFPLEISISHPKLYFFFFAILFRLWRFFSVAIASGIFMVMVFLKIEKKRQNISHMEPIAIIIS